MKLSQLVLMPLASARFDLGTVVEPTDPGLQCPPKCVCSKWTCIDDIDLQEIQSMLVNKPISLANDHLVDQSFKCWKSCCKKQGVQVSVCEQNSCQKCCNSECSDIKSVLKTRRKFNNESCNQCLQQKCNHQDEYTSVITSRSCRGLFNKYTTPFNSSVTFQVEANRDLRIFLYDEPLNLIRQSLRKRRHAEVIDDVLDDTEESEQFERETNSLVDQIHERIRRAMDEQQQKAKELKIEERKKLNSIRKRKRINKRNRKNHQKHLYGGHPANKATPDVTQLMHDLMNDFEEVNVEENIDNASDMNASAEDQREQRAQQYNYEAEYPDYRDEIEVAEAPFDCRDHITKASPKEELKACNAQIKALYKAEKERLRKMSATYRKLKPALDNPAIVNQALTQTKLQILKMGNDVTEDMSSEELAQKDDALTRYLNMYGYNEDSASDVVFQTVFKNNAQQLYSEQQAKQQSNTLDKADWTRPHMLRQVPLQTLGALYVNDKKSQDQQEREERKQQNMFPDGISGYGRSVRLAPGESSNVETSFLEKLDGEKGFDRRVEEGFADEELGFHDDVLTSGWIQIGIGSSNNTSADLKSCQNSSYKRCIGVLRKNFPDILHGENKPQEVTVSVNGIGTERILTVDIKTKGESDSRRIFEVLVDDPTIASLKHMAVCTTKGSRSKLGFCCGNQPNSIYYLNHQSTHVTISHFRFGRTRAATAGAVTQPHARFLFNQLPAHGGLSIQLPG